MLEVDNVATTYENLPYKINGFTLYNASEEFYTVVLNSRQCYETNKRTFEHEIRHIKNNDFKKFASISNIEFGVN